MILIYSPSLARDIDLTRATAADREALKRDLERGAVAPGLRGVVEAAVAAK